MPIHIEDFGKLRERVRRRVAELTLHEKTGETVELAQHTEYVDHRAQKYHEREFLLRTYAREIVDAIIQDSPEFEETEFRKYIKQVLCTHRGRDHALEAFSSIVVPLIARLADGDLYSDSARRYLVEQSIYQARHRKYRHIIRGIEIAATGLYRSSWSLEERADQAYTLEMHRRIMGTIAETCNGMTYPQQLF